MTALRIGIDASNLRRGGGVTHLVQLLRAADPAAHGFGRIVVWGGQETLAQLPHDSSWLMTVHDPLLDGPLPARLFWQRVKMPRVVRGAIDVLFVPGGSYGGDFTPFVTMFQNMLLFDQSERARYGIGWAFLRLALLRRFQAATFQRADGVIFLSAYAQAQVLRVVTSLKGQSAIIPHGIGQEFFQAPRGQRSIENYSISAPFTLLYVSTVDVYKHQWHVVEAVGRLRKAGLPVRLVLAGSAYPPALRRLRREMMRVDPQGGFIQYQGAIGYSRLPDLYRAADGFVFASSCENLPNVLLEAMASGLPIACSNRSPMPDILGASEMYFDPESPVSIALALHRMVERPSVRAESAERAFEKAQGYSWSQCAASTFAFLGKVAAST